MAKRAKRIKSGSAAGFILPSLLGVALFFLVPFIGVFYYAFVDSPVNGRFAGIANFTSLFQNRAFLNAASNTLLFSAVSVPLVMVLSLGFGSSTRLRPVAHLRPLVPARGVPFADGHPRRQRRFDVGNPL